MAGNATGSRGPQSRLDLDNAWRARVHAAEERYHRARAEADAALQSCGCNAASAQIESLSQAQSRETAALDEYLRVLRIFHDWVLAGNQAGP